jgi:lipopolysaccharide export system ATP-binding protein
MSLNAWHLVKTFGARRVVDRVSLHVDPGEIVGLLGPNGAGKTVTFSMLVGELRPTEGRVVLDGDDITTWPLYQRARKGLGYLPQARSIFRHLTVEGNIVAVAEARGLRRRDARARAAHLLDEFGLTRLATTVANRLSGGEMRRLEIARSLAIEPRFLLFDEPFAGIDPLTVETLHEVIVGLRGRGLGILLTDHNVTETLALCDRAYVLHGGSVLAEGPAQALPSDPRVRRHFLGESDGVRASRVPAPAVG